MTKFSVSVDDAKRLLHQTDYSYLSMWHQENLEKELASLPQPPELGPVSEDQYRLVMLEDALNQIGRRRKR